MGGFWGGGRGGGVRGRSRRGIGETGKGEGVVTPINGSTAAFASKYKAHNSLHLPR